MSKKNYFLIFVCIAVFFSLYFSEKNKIGAKFLETIDFENISSIEISFREKNILCNDGELINEFKSVVQKLAVAKDASGRMKRVDNGKENCGDAAGVKSFTYRQFQNNGTGK